MPIRPSFKSLIESIVDKEIAESGGGTGTGVPFHIDHTTLPLPATEGDIAVVGSTDTVWVYDPTDGWVDSGVDSGAVGETYDYVSNRTLLLSRGLPDDIHYQTASGHTHNVSGTHVAVSGSSSSPINGSLTVAPTKYVADVTGNYLTYTFTFSELVDHEIFAAHAGGAERIYFTTYNGTTVLESPSLTGEIVKYKPTQKYNKVEMKFYTGSSSATTRLTIGQILFLKRKNFAVTDNTNKAVGKILEVAADGITHQYVDKPTGGAGGSTVTDSATNGNIVVDGVEVQVYDDSGKADANHTHAELHTHTNKTVIDGLSATGGVLTYNGSAVAGTKYVDDLFTDAILTASSTYSDQYLVTLLRDGNVDDFINGWQSAEGAIPAWIQAAQTGRKGFKRFMLQPVDEPTGPDRMPKDFEVQVSDDGINFTTVATYTNEAPFGLTEQRWYELDEFAYGSHFRIYITATFNSTTVAIGEMMLEGSVAFAERIIHLDDVDISNPVDGQALLYDAASGTWKPGTITAEAPAGVSVKQTNDFTIAAGSTAEFTRDMGLGGIVQSYEVSRTGETLAHPNNFTALTNGAYQVKASSTYQTNYAYNAFDGVKNVDTDHWGTATLPSVGAPQWLAMEMDVAKLVDIVKLTARNNTVTTATPRDFKIQGSNSVSWLDMSGSWVDLGTFSSTAWAQNETRSFNLNNGGVAYKFYRILITANDGNPGYCAIAELEFIRATDSLVQNANIKHVYDVNQKKIKITNNDASQKLVRVVSVG